MNEKARFAAAGLAGEQNTALIAAKRIEQLGKGFRGGRRPIKEAGVGCVFRRVFLATPSSPGTMASPPR